MEATDTNCTTATTNKEGREHCELANAQGTGTFLTIYSRKKENIVGDGKEERGPASQEGSDAAKAKQ